MSDRLLDALRAAQDDQPAAPEYIVGQSTDGALKFLGVDRVSTKERPGGVECASTMFGRRYMITFPKNQVRWVVAVLGAYLTDDEWDQAAQDRLDEIDERSAP